MNKIICGDVLKVLKTLQADSVQCVVTSPPYFGLRDYGVDGQIGLEKTSEEYVSKMVSVFAEVRRVLREDGTLWLNLGDSYAGSCGNGYKQTIDAENRTNAGGNDESLRKITGRDDGALKPKDLCGIPWRVALALQADGWWLRQDIIWHKPNPMPESVTDRCTKSHEYIFLLTKSAKYFYDAEAIKEEAAYNGRNDEMMKGSDKYKEGYVPNQTPQTIAASGHARWQKNDDGLRVRNKRSVWTIATNSYPDAHFATFLEEIPLNCIKAGSKEGDAILDPFSGTGTTCMVAKKLNRNYIGIELNHEYVAMAEKRIETECGTLF